ncbi:membrane protein, partial [Mycobacterium tuberculosis]
MSGPNPPGREPDEPESEPVSDTGDERASGNHLPPVAGGGDKLPSDQTGETDAYSRAYSAPESEHVTGGPYVPADLRLYDYDDYEESSDLDDELAAP